MAIFGPLTNAKFVLNGVDLSDHVVQLKIERSRADLDTTAMSSTGAKTRQGGLFDGTISVDFLQDYTTSKVEATVRAAFESSTGVVTFSANPANSANSATNPNYSGSVLVNSHSPIGGKVGDLEVVTHTWPVSGVLTTTTA